jgi:excinuclease ABC subunit A
VVPDKSLSLRQGAIVPWAKTGNTSPYYTQTLEAVCKHYGAAMSTPWDELDDEVRNVILFGTMDEEITFVYDDGLRTYKTTKPFEGVIGNIERRWQETDSAVGARGAVAVPVRPPCQSCNGYRLKPQALAVKVRPAHRRKSRKCRSGGQ